VFTVERDVELLNFALNHNPWQLGPSKWSEVATSMSEKFELTVSSRTVRDRVNNLIQKKEKEELIYK